MNATNVTVAGMIVVLAFFSLFVSVQPPASPFVGAGMFLMLMALAGVLIVRSRRLKEQGAAPAPKDLNSPEQ